MPIRLGCFLKSIVLNDARVSLDTSLFTHQRTDSYEAILPNLLADKFEAFSGRITGFL